jgi:hypothetical protein
VVNLNPRPLYPRKYLRYTLNMKLDGPQSQSGRYGEDKIKYFASTRVRTPDRLTRSAIAIATSFLAVILILV